MKEAEKIFCDIYPGSCTKVRMLLPTTKIVRMKAFSLIFDRPEPGMLRTLPGRFRSLSQQELKVMAIQVYG